MKVSFVSPKYWAIKLLPFLAVRSALQLVFCFIPDIADPDLHQDPASPRCPSGPCIELPKLTLN